LDRLYWPFFQNLCIQLQDSLRTSICVRIFPICVRDVEAVPSSRGSDACMPPCLLRWPDVQTLPHVSGAHITEKGSGGLATDWRGNYLQRHQGKFPLETSPPFNFKKMPADRGRYVAHLRFDQYRRRYITLIRDHKLTPTEQSSLEGHTTTNLDTMNASRILARRSQFVARLWLSSARHTVPQNFIRNFSAEAVATSSAPCQENSVKEAIKKMMSERADEIIKTIEDEELERSFRRFQVSWGQPIPTGVDALLREMFCSRNLVLKNGEAPHLIFVWFHPSFFLIIRISMMKQNYALPI
jgi:hypothetical protein